MRLSSEMFNLQNYKIFLHKKFNKKRNQAYSHKLWEHIFNTCKQYAECPMNLLPGNQITSQTFLQCNDIHWRLLTYYHVGIMQDFSGV